MPKRWCQDCRQLFDLDATGTRRCPPCQAKADATAAARRARDAAGRPSATRRGYGSAYQRRAAALLERARQLGQACYLCGKPCLPGQALHAHHVDGSPSSSDPATCRLAPAHAACNIGAGAPGRRC